MTCRTIYQKFDEGSITSEFIAAKLQVPQLPRTVQSGDHAHLCHETLLPLKTAVCALFTALHTHIKQSIAIRLLLA